MLTDVDRVRGRPERVSNAVDIARVDEEFGSFDGRVWLNCAHQGPLPRSAQDAARAEIRAKASPHLIEEASFWDLPEELRATVAALIGASADEVVLGNATSYGLNLLAQGLPLAAGDEVLLVDGDFPATVTSWFPVVDRGVEIRLLRPRRHAPTAEEVADALRPSTKVFCSSWVYSFSGHTIDLGAIGGVCRERGVLFVVNGTQAIGARSFDVSTVPVDALVCAGFKWLCGPYGTGFCWITPQVLRELTYRQDYWLAQATPGDLSKEGAYEVSSERRVQSYDLFCTANFLNFSPWLAALRLLSDIGIQTIEQHDQELVDELVDGVGRLDFELVSPASGASRSTLVCLRHRALDGTRRAHDLLREAGVDVALRQDVLRISPHLYNTRDDVVKVRHTLRAR